MKLELMYITNSPIIADYAENAGIDFIFVDLEYIGKEERQHNMDTVKSHHTIDDVKRLRSVISKSKLLVRVNPINKDSKDEIDNVIESGADYIMLPMYKSVDDVKKFITYVNGRAKVILLLETIDAEKCIDDVIKLDGIDRIHIGLNDLHLEKKKKFMFELLCDGTIENLCDKISKSQISYGFGGVSRIGCGILPASLILSEHYRLGSTSVILSRDFCDLRKVSNEEAEIILKKGVEDVRNYENELSKKNKMYFNENKQKIKNIVEEIIRRK